MFTHILMPTDGSEHSERAVKRGVQLAKLCGARITGIHVLPDFSLAIADDGSLDPSLPEKLLDDGRAHARGFLDFVQRTADAEGVPCETVIATGAKPFDAIVSAAAERGCDLIVMTSRYRKGLAALVLGSESTRVLHRASIPVLVFRGLMSADHPDKATPAR